MRPLSASYFAVGLALATIGFGTPVRAEEGYRHGRLRFTEPGVMLQRATDTAAEEADVNAPFLPGDRVWTDASGRAEFQFPDGTVVRLDRRSKLDYSGHEEDGSERIVLRLWSGSLMLRGRERQAAQFEVETPGGTVIVRERSMVRVDVDAGEARVSVYEGEAVLDDGRTRVQLAEGERTYSRWGDSAEDPERFDTVNADDEFARWDEDRESEVRWASSSPYLPGELEVYGGELEGYGDWRQEPSVGSVWVPRVDVGWSPYSNGHWTWTPYGWTWVPYDRWGWAPFHYGRWDLSASWGWYWVPDRIWGPAWVSWAVGGGYVGWCPLGRHDRPVIGWDSWHSSRGQYDRGDRGHAVPRRGRFGSEPRDAWHVLRQGELGRRDVARLRVPFDRVDAGTMRVAATPRLRPTRDGGRLLEGDAVPRAIRTRPTPGDFVRELAVDNKTTIPSPWFRRGDRGVQRGPADGYAYDRGERTGQGAQARSGRSTARPGGADAQAPSGDAARPEGEGQSDATSRRGRAVPWFRPADQQAGSGGAQAGEDGAGVRGGSAAERRSPRRAPEPGAVTVQPRTGGDDQGGGSRPEAGSARPRHERPSGRVEDTSDAARPAAGEDAAGRRGATRVPVWRAPEDRGSSPADQTAPEARRERSESRPPAWSGGESRPDRGESRPAWGARRGDSGESHPPATSGGGGGESRRAPDSGSGYHPRNEGGGRSSGGGGDSGGARPRGGDGGGRSSGDGGGRSGGGHSGGGRSARPRN